MALDASDLSNLWSNSWYQPYMDGRPILYFPEIVMGNYGTYGVGSAWWQIPEGYSLHARFNKYLQRHSIKSGTEVRIKRGEAARFRYFNFAINANATANTTDEPEPATGRPSVGQLHARRAREHLERRIRADADVRHRDVRAVSCRTTSAFTRR